MPVLESEPALFPPTLFGGGDAEGGYEDTNSEPWWVLHTRPRAEKALARWLVSRRLSFFLPLYERSYRAQRRTVRSYLPLFPGYLFLRGDDAAREAAFRVNQVVRCLDVPDQDGLRRDLQRVHDLINAGVPLAPEARLEPGMPAEIIRGPLAGNQGIVVRKRQGLRFVLAVDFIQRGASVEVEASMIRPL